MTSLLHRSFKWPSGQYVCFLTDRSEFRFQIRSYLRRISIGIHSFPAQNSEQRIQSWYSAFLVHGLYFPNQYKCQRTQLIEIKNNAVRQYNTRFFLQKRSLKFSLQTCLVCSFINYLECSSFLNEHLALTPQANFSPR